jgi:hypothetical protein
MKRPKQEEQPPTVYVGDHTDRLSRIGKRISYEDDDRRART